MTAEDVKASAKALGAEFCGIAPVGRFVEAPPGFHPTDILPECRSVVVTAMAWPEGNLRSSSMAAYTFVRSRLSEMMDAITFAMTCELEKAGHLAVTMPSHEPYDFWDIARRHGHGVLSLRHAAEHAGLGHLGRNTLLMNDRFGNLLWLGALLTDAELEPDELASYEACIPGCDLCLSSCPMGALDGTTVEQSKCRAHMSKSSEGGGFVYNCNLCRTVCPNYRGIKA